MSELQDLFKKVVLDGKEKKKSKKDPVREAVKEEIRKVKAKEREKRGFQNGAGYDYVKVWDEQGIGYRMVPTARVRMAEILGRELQSNERVFIIDKKLKGDAKYAPSNLLLGDSNGIRLDLLVCKACRTQGEVVGNHVHMAK